MFSDSREAKLSAGAFGFRCNPQRKKNHELARVHVNPEDMAPLKLTMNRGKGCTSRSLSYGCLSAILPDLKHVFR